MNPLKLVVVTPVFNDWESLDVLIRRIDEAVRDEGVHLSILVINDASTKECDTNGGRFRDLDTVEEIELLHLSCNLGHQRAIAIGLADVVNRKKFDAVVVMDSDGEDRPEDIPALLAEYRLGKEEIVVARRDQRSEGVLFRAGYRIYKLLFRLLTGKKIPFGNFCLIPAESLKRIAYLDSLWNHLAATILRSRLPLTMVATKRGNRHAGKTHLNKTALVLLGLSAVAVYSDVVLVRTLFTSLFLGIVTVAGIIAVATIRFTTDMAIPGWASDVVGSLTVILIQSLVISVLVLFVILANRNQRTFIPAKHFSDYILDRQVLLRK